MKLNSAAAGVGRNRAEKDAIDKMEAEMANMIGQDDVKRRFRQICCAILDMHSGETPLQRNDNIIVYGPPGVGKTSMVKMLYEALTAVGILKGKWVHVKSGKGLMGKGTLEKYLADAKDGMLFVDEAYHLEKCRDMNTQLTSTIDPSGGSVMIVIAGYEDRMKSWLSPKNRHGNPGLVSRFNHHVLMHPYNADELMLIADLMMKTKSRMRSSAGITASLEPGGARDKLKTFAGEILKMEDSVNARSMERLLEAVCDAYRNRCVAKGLDSSAMLLSEGDVSQGYDNWMENVKASRPPPKVVGSSGGMSEAAKEAVVAELRKLTDDGRFEEAAGSIVKLNDFIGKGEDLEGYLTPECLLLLGTENEVENATKHHAPIPSSFLANLKKCVVAAWPNCTVKDNGVKNKAVPGHPGLKMSGHYVDGLRCTA